MKIKSGVLILVLAVLTMDSGPALAHSLGIPVAILGVLAGVAFSIFAIWLES